MSRPPRWLSRNWLDALLLLLFGASALAVFFAEIYAVQQTPREGSLFGALEFLLAILVGWLLQRIASREEFFKSLRGYAISAYRRISDIQKSVDRLASEISRMRQSYPSDHLHELDILSALTAEMTNTVRSSTYDWSDIIGDELEKIRKVERLESELRVAALRGPVQRDSQATAFLSDLQGQIESLRAELPILIESTFPGHQEPMPRAERESRVVLDHYLSMIEAQGCIYLLVTSHGSISQEHADRIKTGAPYSVREERAMMQFHVEFVDREGKAIGEVQNPFETSGVYRNDHSYTLMNLLAEAFGAATEGPQIVPLPNAEVVTLSQAEGRISIRVPITIDMIAKG